MAHHLTDLTIELDEKVGSVAAAAEALGKAGVNIEGICGFVVAGKGGYRQNSKRIPSCVVLGLPPLSTWPNCGVPMVTLEPVPRLSIGWLKILKNSARNWIL